MRRTSISDLKARLSMYLREVQRGGEVEILDRGVPIARLVRVAPAGDSPDEERRTRLVEEGVLHRGDSPVARLLQTPPLDLPTSILEALEEERADRL